MDLDQWRNFRLWGEAHHCNTKVRLPDVVMTVPNAIVTSEGLNQVVGWAVRNELEGGAYNLAKEMALRNYTANLCPEMSLVGKKEALSVNDLGAPLFMLLIVATVSLVIKRVGMAVARREEAIKSKLDINADGHLTTDEFIRSVTRRVKKTKAKPPSPTTVTADGCGRTPQSV